MYRLVTAIAFVSGLASSALAEHRARAVRLKGTIAVDGKLDEPAWQSAPRHKGFTQRFPNDGAKASYETSFSVLYDDAAV
jgi:hypothetical protein